MKKQEPHYEFIAEGADSDRYLGSPQVIQVLVDGFCDQVYELTKARGAGELAKDEFAAKLREFVRVFGDIFMGRNANYQKVVGWNSPYGLGMALKQSLGEFWERHKAEYGDDPGQAAFGWLAASLVECAVKSLKDADQAGAAIQTHKEQLTRVLLGAHRRA
jgi:hypothetical protein